jgi:hypothetical protein
MKLRQRISRFVKICLSLLKISPEYNVYTGRKPSLGSLI